MAKPVLTPYEQTLLDGWEAVYKKGQLTLWILLALKDRPRHMAAISEFITHSTNHTLAADTQSMYRALRRYHKAELVGFTAQKGSGPDRKVYHLTVAGQHVLDAFIKRNVSSIFYDPTIKRLLNRQ